LVSNSTHIPEGRRQQEQEQRKRRTITRTRTTRTPLATTTTTTTTTTTSVTLRAQNSAPFGSETWTSSRNYVLKTLLGNMQNDGRNPVTNHMGCIKPLLESQVSYFSRQ